jgi:hypothetical protein
MRFTQILPCVCTWSCQMYDWQLEREEAQHRMRWKMMEEERLWDKERITAMLMEMDMGTGMGMGDMDAMM